MIWNVVKSIKYSWKYLKNARITVKIDVNDDPLNVEVVFFLHRTFPNSVGLNLNIRSALVNIAPGF